MSANGLKHSLAYVQESSFGVTPSTPSMTLLRNTSCSLGFTKGSLQSEERRSDGQLSDLRHGNIAVSGDVGFELSYGEYDALLAATLFGAWNDNELIFGDTQPSFTMERRFADVSQYHAYTGCTPNKLSLSIQPEKIVTGTFGFVGKGVSMSGTPMDASPTASQTNIPFDSFNGTCSEGGASIAIVTGVELALDRTLDPAYTLFANTARGLAANECNLTGTISAMFEDDSLLEEFLNETETSLAFTLGDGSSKSYTFSLPRIKYTGGGQIERSSGGALALSMPFTALYDAATTSSMKITRIP